MFASPWSPRAATARRLLLATVVPCAATSAAGESLRLLPPGQFPDDVRRAARATLDGPHPFRQVASREAWEQRRQEIRLRVQVAAGLWPLPSAAELRPWIEGASDQGDYRVERAVFESLPGHFVTGNLYRPAGPSRAIGLRGGRRPAVLCPHGHWDDGRFHDAGEPAALGEIARGAERFVSGARSPLQARCVQLARMGCVVFHYDMLGYADSRQFVEHRDGPRAEMNGLAAGQWGFESAAAAGRLQSRFGLQTYNSLRALDFVLSLPETDPDRVLVTGASGGGTQTMMAAAIDPRIDAVFPCVMASTAMQGGCTCENACLLRIGQGNIDIAASAAPVPQGLTSAKDWTIELETKGHPDLVRVYELANAAGNYEAHFNVHFPHNYNHVSRTQMYQFVNRHFELGLASPVLERDFELLDRGTLSAWTAAHPAPHGAAQGDAHQRAVNRWWADDSDAQVERLLDVRTAEGWQALRAVLGPALETIVGRRMPGPTEATWVVHRSRPIGEGRLEFGMLRQRAEREALPAVVAWPPRERFRGDLVLQVHRRGKQSLFAGARGELSALAARLLASGTAVAAVDLFQQGEFLAADESAVDDSAADDSAVDDSAVDNATLAGRSRDDAPTSPADGWRESSVYHFGYNHSLFARRVHDILTAVAALRHAEGRGVRSLTVVGGEGAGPWVAAARGVAGAAIDRALVDARGFRFAQLDSPWHADFLPGAVKYGDVTGMLALSAPHPLVVRDDDPRLRETLGGIYAAAGASAALRFCDDAETLEDSLPTAEFDAPAP